MTTNKLLILDLGINISQIVENNVYLMKKIVRNRKDICLNKIIIINDFNKDTNIRQVLIVILSSRSIIYKRIYNIFMNFKKKVKYKLQNQILQ